MGKSIIIKGADFSANAIKGLKWNIVYSLTHTSLVSSPTTIGDGNTLNLQFVKTDGYEFPASVTVTNTLTSATITTGVTYNYLTGVLKIVGVGANLTITAEGAEDLSPFISATPSIINFSVEEGSTGTDTFEVSGMRLTGGVTLTLTDSNNKFTISKNSLTVSEAEEGETITVTYAGGTENDEHTATILISSDGADSLYITLNGVVTQQMSGTFNKGVIYGGYWNATQRSSNNTYGCCTNIIPVKGDVIKFYGSDGTTLLDKKLKVVFYSDEDTTKTSGLTAVGTTSGYFWKKNNLWSISIPTGAKTFSFSCKKDGSTNDYDQMTDSEIENMVIKWEVAQNS